MIDHRPANGGGSCARCNASLGLASLKAADVWYCSTACANGEPRSEERSFRVPEPRLYARPQRHFRRRRPRELQLPRPDRSSED